LEGQVCNLEALVRTLCSRHHWCVADERIVNPRKRDQVGLELVQIHIQRTVESKTRCNGADDLSNETIEVIKTWSRNVEIAAANIVDGFVIDQERTVRVFNGAVGGEDSVVGLDDCSGDSRSWVNGKFEFALLSVVGRETFQEQGTESRSSTATERVEDQEALQRRAVVCA
jgi:hypothetical protein